MSSRWEQITQLGARERLSTDSVRVTIGENEAREVRELHGTTKMTKLI